jgi:AmmeMemoRadiSam system protein A
MYSPEQRKQLLSLARASLKRGITHNGSLPELDAALGSQERAAFVTLTRREQLRGCIGTLATDRPLRETIAELAVSSATEDPRFPRVRPDEVDDLRIEISVLSPPVDAGPEDVVIGMHGLIVEHGRRRGLLLPQVATEHHLTREQFLDAVCQKAGLPASAWREPGVRLQTFTAEVFGEQE